jgi:hypothetical protein
MCLINCIILVLSSFMMRPNILASVSVFLKVSCVLWLNMAISSAQESTVWFLIYFVPIRFHWACWRVIVKCYINNSGATASCFRLVFEENNVDVWLYIQIEISCSVVNLANLTNLFGKIVIFMPSLSLVLCILSLYSRPTIAHWSAT